MRILVLGNHKGGAGKTSTVINLAAALGERYRVLVVDLDPQGHSSWGLGKTVPGRGESAGALLMHPRADFHDRLVHKPVPGVDLIAGIRDELETARLQLERDTLTGSMALRLGLQQFDEEYAYCLVDTPPALDSLTVNALVAATEVMISMIAAPLHYEGALELAQTVADMRAAGINREARLLGVLLNIHDPRTLVARQVVADLESAGAPQLRTTIPRDIRVDEAYYVNQPVVALYPNARASLAYQQLAREIEELVPPPPSLTAATSQGGRA